MEYIIYIVVFLLVNQFIYDRYVQRQSTLLINYPILARMRYVFEALREPLRQYFGEEKFYESRDKIDWVYKSAKGKPAFISFSVSQPFHDSRFIIKNASAVLNDNEISNDFSLTFGDYHKQPFVTKSIIGRSAMSDGALSPEATRAATLGAFKAKFPVNTGEGGLTSNHFFAHKINEKTEKCFEIIDGNETDKSIYKITKKFFNGAIAAKYYRKRVLKNKQIDTFILDLEKLKFFRVDWSKPLEDFPQTIPEDMPDIVLQIGSGLYGVRGKDGKFDPDRYQKVMRFCKMTEIKIAQGAKQTGGKIIGSKVTEDIAYYRGVEVGKDLMSPNRFPYASSYRELFDFIGNLQKLSEKPVGMKIVVSDAYAVETLVRFIKDRIDNGLAFPDFVTIDGADGGSATAPLELMEAVGLNVVNGIYLLDHYLRQYGLRDRLKIIASGKILTPDDVVILLALGADMTNIGRGFMMSGGCIRARHCSGVEGVCPVGMATQDKKKRASYLVFIKADHIANYHNSLIKGIKTILAVTGVDHFSQLSKQNLAFKNKTGEVFFNVDSYFKQKLHI